VSAVRGSPRKIFEISRVAVAVEELRRRRRKNAMRRGVILAVSCKRSRRRRGLLVVIQPPIVYIVKCLNATIMYFERKLNNGRYGLEFDSKNII